MVTPGRFACPGCHRAPVSCNVPPPQWQGIGRGLHSDWFLPGFPRQHGKITVLPAYPVADQESHTSIDRCLFGLMFEPELSIGLTHRVSANHLNGHLIERTGAGCLVDEVVLCDKRYFYPFRLECDMSVEKVCRAAFRSVWQSAVPLVWQTTAQASDLFLLWTE